MIDGTSANEVEAKEKDNTLGVAWYFAILVLVVLIMHFASLFLGILLSALGNEAFIASAISLLAGVIVCCTVYLASIILRAGKG